MNDDRSGPTACSSSFSILHSSFLCRCSSPSRYVATPNLVQAHPVLSPMFGIETKVVQSTRQPHVQPVFRDLARWSCQRASQVREQVSNQTFQRPQVSA